MNDYKQLLAEVTSTPWAIEDHVLHAIVESLRSPPLPAARYQASPVGRRGQTRGATAILPLYGVLMQRSSFILENLRRDVDDRILAGVPRGPQ